MRKKREWMAGLLGLRRAEGRFRGWEDRVFREWEGGREEGWRMEDRTGMEWAWEWAWRKGE